MHNLFVILLVLPVMVRACDLDTHYINGDQCCTMCPPGKKLPQNADCSIPMCEDCKDGEYQDVYNKYTKCKRQPICDPNLNFMKQTNPSKTELSPCPCLPDHHCSSENCETCVRNTVCQAGQRVWKMGNRTSDTVCKNCSHGTFSNTQSAMTCQPWTECTGGFHESVPGSSTSDRTCEATTNVKAIVLSVIAVLFLAALAVIVYYWRKDKNGSMDLEEKKHCGMFCKDLRTKETHNNVALEDELPQVVVNQPEEDTEDLFKNGVSANGMPVRQDNSKASLLSQPETAASAISYEDHL
ncbi:tumor necrosis factor receptor superfamily member 5 isoform X1 [Brachyhypopomus gauderio]|uniref:tumor necrosis factor receptor superfamily member 5 isoform X1 n=1 Tax=Brachyhypopomus gauderio TaxID=698409 RepID=UPI0040427091